MDFREGMLGVVVVALALTGALFVSYFAGVESTEEEYVAYDYLADVSGLFEYDQSPTYIEYDPSTNYTGYYSTETGEYWPSGIVDYEANNKANNYKINYEPTVISSSDVLLSTYTTGVVEPISNPHVIFANKDYQYYSSSPTVITLQSYINAMGLSNSVTELNIKSLGDYSENGSDSTYNAEWVSFSTAKMWEDSTGDNDTLWMSSAGWFSGNNYSIPYQYVQADGWTYYYYLPCLSVSVDISRGIATLYYDKDCSEDSIYTKTSLDSVYIAYGGGTSTARNIVLDDTATITVLHAERSYLDPNQGVSLTPTLVVSAYPMNNGVVTGSGKYYVDDTVTITAVPNSGYVFKEWSDGSTSATRTITVTSDNVGQMLTYIAYFEADE